MADVTTQHEHYPAMKKRISLVDDVVSSMVKEKPNTYLPDLDPNDSSKAAQNRKQIYNERAVWLGFTGRTLAGLVGAAFMRDPEIDLAPGLAFMEDDVDGMGNGIEQQSRSVLSRVVSGGRHALFVDFPVTEGEVSRADRDTYRPTIVSLKAEQVINWKISRVGSRYLYTMVVIYDPEIRDTDDGFGTERVERYRVLRLGVPGAMPDAGMIYYQEIHTKEPGSSDWMIQTLYPQDNSGNRFTEILFTFCGAENNDAAIDDAPMYDLATLNIAHYRNSADYEDSVFWCGQIQPWASGLSPAWVQMLEEKGLKIGSRQLLPLPENGSFGFAQPSSNPLAGEAMEKKEEQAKMLGARLLTPGSSTKTATEADDDSAAAHSPLSLAASNVSEAYARCLSWAAMFTGDTQESTYKISQEFTRPNIDSQAILALVGLWNSGQYPKADLWAQLKKGGIMRDLPDDEIEGELDAEGPGLDLGDV